MDHVALVVLSESTGRERIVEVSAISMFFSPNFARR
jgi:hypothetical protein